MKTIVCGFIGLILIASNASSSELAVRRMIRDQAKALFQTNSFSKLNKLALRYLETEERTPSGLWKLTILYSALRGIPTTKVTNEDYWDNLENRALQWVAEYPNSPAGHLIYASFVYRHAWVYRGTSSASKVREEDWAPFYAHLKKAKEYLYEHKVIAAQDPLWYDLMVDIAMSEGWSMTEFQSLVEEGTTLFPYYYQLYFASIGYLHPRWHGSLTEIENFADWAVSVTREQEDNGMYARIYWYASQIGYGEELFTETDVQWSKMRASIDDVLARYPDQWNINNFAFFSCLAHDNEKAKELMNMIEGRPILKAWKRVENFDICRDWVQRLEQDPGYDGLPTYKGGRS